MTLDDIILYNCNFNRDNNLSEVISGKPIIYLGFTHFKKENNALI